MSIGTAVLEALKTEVNKSKSGDGDVKVVLIGHDRGARVAHHVTVSGVDGVEILGVCLIDIVCFSALDFLVSGRLILIGPNLHTMAALHPPSHRRKGDNGLLSLAAARKRRSSNAYDHRFRPFKMVSRDDPTLVWKEQRRYRETESQ